MKKLLFLVAIAFGIQACGPTPYNEEAVSKYLKDTTIFVNHDTFVNNSNLIHSQKNIITVISTKDLPNRSVNAIKAYLKDKNENAQVKYYYKPEAY